MLEHGPLDALFTANVPQPVLDGSPNITRLFPDFEPDERDYYRRPGVFPMMHTIVVRRDVLNANPGLTRAVYTAFRAAKDAAADGYRQVRRLYEVTNMNPWLNALFERNTELLGEDWWPYGIAANRTALDTNLRYHHEQGLSQKLWSVEEIFAPDLLETEPHPTAENQPATPPGWPGKQCISTSTPRSAAACRRTNHSSRPQRPKPITLSLPSSGALAPI